SPASRRRSWSSTKRPLSSHAWAAAMPAASSRTGPPTAALSRATSTRRKAARAVALGGASAGLSGAAIAVLRLAGLVAADAEAMAGLGESEEAILDEAADRVCREAPRGVTGAGGPPGQELDALLD